MFASSFGDTITGVILNGFKFFLYSMRNKIPKVPAKYRSIDLGVIIKRFLGCCLYIIKKKIKQKKTEYC